MEMSQNTVRKVLQNTAQSVPLIEYGIKKI